MKTSILLEEAADDLWNLELPLGAKFDMSSYGAHPKGQRPKQDNLCQTTACAAGWLSLMPKWHNRGFQSKWHRSLLTGEWLLVPAPAVGWETMAESVFGATSEDMRGIFLKRSASLEEVVLMFEDLAEDYEAMEE